MKQKPQLSFGEYGICVLGFSESRWALPCKMPMSAEPFRHEYQVFDGAVSRVRRRCLPDIYYTDGWSLDDSYGDF